MLRNFLAACFTLATFLCLSAFASAQATAVNVNSLLQNVPYGPTPVNLSVTSSSGIPQGYFYFIIDGGTAQPGPFLDNNGNTTITLPSINVGNHTVEFDYTSTNGFDGSSTTVPISVVQDSIGISISTDSSTASYGSGPNVQVTVTGGPHYGNLTYWADGTELISLAPFTQFTALYPSTTIPAGTHNLYVRFDSLDGNTMSAQSNQVPINVSRGTPQVFLNGSPNPAQTGFNIEFNALIEPAANIAGVPPTGTIDFSEGSTDFGTVPITVNGFGTSFCSIAVPTLPGGYHTITATYSGDSNYTPGSITWLETVYPLTIPTSTSLGTDSQTYVYNQPIQVSATVTSSNGTPTGTVAVDEALDPLASISLTNGQGNCMITPGLPVGSYTLTGIYQPTGQFDQSASSGTAITVNPATPTLQLSGPSQVNYNEPFTYVASVVGPYGGSASGNVTVRDGLNSFGPFPVSGTSAACSITLTSGVSHTLTFQYSGDANFNMASNTASVTVLFNTPPVLSGVPTNITVDATSAAGAVVTYPTPTATSIVDGTDPVQCTPASGSTFPIGMNLVTCTSTDSQGHTATATFGVDVLSPQLISDSTLASLEVLNLPTTQDQQTLNKAIQDLVQASDSSLWATGSQPISKGGDKVFNFWSDAANQLTNLIKHPKGTVPQATLAADLARIVNTARVTALAAMATATGKNLTNAQNEFSQGDASVSVGNFQDAINHYRNAWKHAVGK